MPFACDDFDDIQPQPTLFIPALYNLKPPSRFREKSFPEADFRERSPLVPV